MNEREKVIKGLECCAVGCRPGCPYFDIVDDCEGVLCADALALLKAQEPKVMTLKEYDEWANIPFTERDPVFFEQKLRRGIMTWWTNTAEFRREEYGKRERCWTSRPTDEQREATPWN